MLSHGFSVKPSRAESAVVRVVADILVEHLDDPDADVSPPVLIHVDGPGRTLFLKNVACTLDSGRLDLGYKENHRPLKTGSWTTISFDAWQYQRVAPPWWWLIKAIDNQLRERFRDEGPWKRFRKRAADWDWRTRQLLKDILLVLPVVVVSALVAGLAWRFSGKQTVGEVLEWAATALAAITAVVGFAWSGWNALRRHLLVESPAGAAAVLRTSDPMDDLARRYAFLIRSAETPVAILIDNLDRCRAEYVVELLEGIQTLLKDPKSHRDLSKKPKSDTAPPMVVYLVAGDSAWLCESYMQVYKDFHATAQEPGRPFGLAFVDKIFDLSVRIPTVSAALSAATSPDLEDYLANPARAAEADAILNANSELAVRRKLHEAERRSAEPPPHPVLRLCAVRRLAELELDSHAKACGDTHRALKELQEVVEPGPGVRNVFPAYCVQRTAQLLGGHVVDNEDAAIWRLGAWTILTLRWPQLADHLERCPRHLEALCSGTVPQEIDEQLAAVFRLRAAQRFARLARERGLDAKAIECFSTPLAVPSRPPAAPTADRLGHETVGS